LGAEDIPAEPLKAANVVGGNIVEVALGETGFEGGGEVDRDGSGDTSDMGGVTER